jgi:hypothetical protein
MMSLIAYRRQEETWKYETYCEPGAEPYYVAGGMRSLRSQVSIWVGRISTLEKGRPTKGRDALISQDLTCGTVLRTLEKIGGCGFLAEEKMTGYRLAVAGRSRDWLRM